MSVLRTRTKGKSRKQVSISPDAVKIGLALAQADSRSFSSFLEFLIRQEAARKAAQ